MLKHIYRANTDVFALFLIGNYTKSEIEQEAACSIVNELRIRKQQIRVAQILLGFLKWLRTEKLVKLHKKE